MSNENLDSKRAKVDKLRQQIRDKKQQMAVDSAAASDAVKAKRLDDEAERLQRELAALDAGTVAAPPAPAKPESTKPAPADNQEGDKR